jgi:hypothetical protein
MRLFAVRLLEDKQAVGFFWAANSSSLWWMIDSVCDPGLCEYHRISERAAIMWDGKVTATLGAGSNLTDEDEASGESSALDELRAKMDFSYAFEDFLYGTVEEWTKVPYADEPGGGIHELIQGEEDTARKKRRKARKRGRKRPTLRR